MMNWGKEKEGMEWMETKVRGKDVLWLPSGKQHRPWEAGSLVTRQVGGQRCKAGRSGTLCPLGLCHIRGPENQCSQGTSLLARDDGWRS